ncbi:hypothetical protein FO519_007330 [Halicephalobus sp. NKZ332]|nr:hypothetical protein FO519_007330 [Halicephalobus sp. NKZ332]
MFQISRRCFNAAASVARQVEPQWDIYAAVAVCRLPIVAPEMTPIQKKFVQIQSEIENQRSFKSDFELREEKDKKILEKRKQLEEAGKDLSLLEGELGKTAMMEEEEWIKKKQISFETYGISRDAFEDKKNPKTLSRAFDKKLILLVRQRFASMDKYSSPWILPQLKNDGESLRQTAERCVGEIFNGNVKLSIYGNAPQSHITYKYPKKLVDQLKTASAGGKVFIFQCFVDDPLRDVKFNDKMISDYRWCTVDEVPEVLGKQNLYQKTVSHILYE